jgi:hypothetical protein
LRGLDDSAGVLAGVHTYDVTGNDGDGCLVWDAKGGTYRHNDTFCQIHARGEGLVVVPDPLRPAAKADPPVGQPPRSEDADCLAEGAAPGGRKYRPLAVDAVRANAGDTVALPPGDLLGALPERTANDEWLPSELDATGVREKRVKGIRR